MNADDRHPSSVDLANLASEKLGRKKTQRIIEHCKGCPECADRLLDVVSRQPAGGEKMRLSKWNWISIAILVLSLLAVFGLMVWLLRGATPPVPALTQPPVG